MVWFDLKVEDGSNFIIIFILFLLSAFFSGSETAFFSLSKIYIKKLENQNNPNSKRILKLLAKPRQLLISVLLGNTFVNMAISSFATLIALKYNHLYFHINDSSLIAIQIVVTTTLVLMFGEILPKLIALSIAYQFSSIASVPLLGLKYILYPIIRLLELFSTIISKKPSIDKQLSTGISTEEFHSLIHSQSAMHPLEEHEKRMLVGLFRFPEAQVTEIFVPRVRVTAINENATLDELKHIIAESGYSRIPVYREQIDDIVGIVYAKDVLLKSDASSISELMRPAWFVTENMKVQTLLNQFKSRKLQIAIVVDEYGGTSGIVTLEDILEEIVGEINDEYDIDEDAEIVKLNDYSFLLNGNYSIRQLNHEFNLNIDPDEYDNIADFLLEKFNHVPRINETYQYSEFKEFVIIDADERSIKRIQLNIIHSSNESE